MLDVVCKRTIEPKIDVIFPQGADASSSIRQVVSGTLMGRMVALKMIYLPHNPVIVVFLRKRVFEMSLC